MPVESIPFTKEGYEKLTQELNSLKQTERPSVIAQIAEARAHGDLSENAEYHAAREKQAFIEGRIQLLEDRLSRAKVVEADAKNQNKVGFGAYVTLEQEDNEEEKTYQIVGELEADIEQNKISISSPLAKGLLGKRLDDVIEVKVPKGRFEYVITDIHY